MYVGPTIRGRGLGAACLLLLACALAAAPQSAQQPASKDEAPSPKAALNKQHSTTAHSTSSRTGSKARSTNAASSKHKRSSRKASHSRRGQQKIDGARAREIQEALIREHYLRGEATGKWNQASEDAMRRYQAENGWQSKTVPDSRALIKLGLGPSHAHLLNPESAMTTPPGKLGAASSATAVDPPHVPAPAPVPDPASSGKPPQ